MDFGALPPEINSGLMYSGPGSGTILGAASAWDGLASELRSAASSYESLITALTTGPWQGASSTAMAAAAAPYVSWVSTTAEQAEQAASQARSAAGAYHVAFAMTVPPPVIAANRAQLMALVATNFFGQNTPAIAATEAQYMQMWAQDATAMYGYADNAAAASTMTAFTSPPTTTNAEGLANQAAATSQATGTGSGSVTQTITNALQGLTSPAASTSSTTSLDTILTDILNALGFTSSSASTGTTSVVNPITGTIDTGSLAQQLIAQYAILPGFFAMQMGVTGLAPMIYSAETTAMTAQPAAAAAGGASAAAGASEGAAAAAGGSAMGSAFTPQAWAGVGEGAQLGQLSVPQNWLWSAAQPMDAVVPMGTPILMPASGAAAMEGGSPMMFGGLPRAAAAGAAAGAGAAAVKYGTRSKVMARPPAAGYAEEEAARVEPAASNGQIPNGHAPHGYRPAIVYVPANGTAPSTN